jgi:hypothetical protein
MFRRNLWYGSDFIEGSAWGSSEALYLGGRCLSFPGRFMTVFLGEGSNKYHSKGESVPFALDRQKGHIIFNAFS